MKLLLLLILISNVLFSSSIGEVCVKELNIKSDSSSRYADVCVYVDKEIAIFEVKQTILMRTTTKTIEELSSTKGKRKYIKQLEDELKSKVYLTHLKLYREVN